MKPWLSTLVEELSEGRAPVLALASVGQVAAAALFDARGALLGGGLGRAELQKAASENAAGLAPGEAARLEIDGADLSLEAVSPQKLNFWQEALKAQDGAWAAWLLSIPQTDAPPRRHVISSFGIGGKPVLPPKTDGLWSLLPLSPGLGRLFVFGDDASAMELAGLAARAGLVVTAVSVSPSEAALLEARALADFNLARLDSWDELTESLLTDLGLRPGVKLIVATEALADKSDLFKSFKPAHLGLPQDNLGVAPLLTVARAI